MNIRVFDIEAGIWTLILTMLVLAVLLIKFTKGAVRAYIPMLVLVYGCFFCWLMIYVIGEGFSGIVFVLISWLLLALVAVSLVSLLVKRLRR